MILEDYMKYIEYFHKEFEITNNKDDIYYTFDLIFGLEQYGEENELFDYYLIRDFKIILQCYFKIININLNNAIIYGIKKIIPISFIFYDNLLNVITYILEKIDYKKDDIDYTDYLYNRSKSELELEDIYNNRLYIETIKENLYTIWHSIYIKHFDYDITNEEYNGSDEYIIMKNKHYSYDYYNLDYISTNLLKIINNITERYPTILKIVNNEYIQLF